MQIRRDDNDYDQTGSIHLGYGQRIQLLLGSEEVRREVEQGAERK